VEIKRFLSIALIFVVLSSNLGFSIDISSDNLTIKEHSYPTHTTQLAEDVQDAVQVFRENLKIAVSTVTKVGALNFYPNTGLCFRSRIWNARCFYYLQKQLSQKPSGKLFLEFRSLLI
jgi:hypothetical protein